jgi:hypothetical protein
MDPCYKSDCQFSWQQGGTGHRPLGSLFGAVLAEEVGDVFFLLFLGHEEELFASFVQARIRLCIQIHCGGISYFMSRKSVMNELGGREQRAEK